MSNRKLNEADSLVDLSKPDLRTLAVVLRNRLLWPPGFVWDYTNCKTCALGMAHQLWSHSIPGTTRPYAEGPLGLTDAEGLQIFVGLSETYAGRKNVTPEMVADEIEVVLATHSVGSA